MPAAEKHPLLYLGEALARYAFGHDHPFGPGRMSAFADAAKRRGLLDRVQLIPPVMAARDVIARFHTDDYIERVARLSRAGEGWLDAGDTPAFPGMFEAAATVAGSVIDAADRLMRGEGPRAFVPIAGLHHARRDAAAGFCVFNDCGILIEHLKQVHHLSRIAYVDIDAHHGDGVFYAFESDPAVYIADIHQDGRFLYPGSGAACETGRGQASRHTLNLPLQPGVRDDAFNAVWERAAAHVRASRPGFVILQCGADSIAGDPLTGLCLSPACHARAATELRAIADEFAGGRLLALGGGGYSLPNIAAAWCAVLQSLL